MIDYVLPSLLNLIDPFNIGLMLLGLAGGIITGALPGLSATMGVALMVPVTFAMNPTSGLIMLGAIYVGAIYGGANSAILICTPGTPSSVARHSTDGRSRSGAKLMSGFTPPSSLRA